MRVNCRSRLGFGVVLLRPERVRCWSFSLSTIGHCAWRHPLSFSNGCEKETKQRKSLQTPAGSERPRTIPPVVRK
jgi:hypothetical protein